MYRAFGVLGIAWASLLIVSAPARSADAKKAETLARDTAVRFARAFQQHAMDDMVQDAGLPFFYRPGGVPFGSVQVIPSPLSRSDKELRSRLKQKVPGTLPTDVERVGKYADYRNKLLVSDFDRKDLDTAAGKDAWVVSLTRKGKVGVCPVIVKVEKGKAKVVGLVWLWSEKDDAEPHR
jgi:hypothetical protein